MFASMDICPRVYEPTDEVEMKVYQETWDRDYKVDKHYVSILMKHVGQDHRRTYKADHAIVSMSAAQLAELRDTIGHYLADLAAAAMQQKQEVQS